jgi:glyoxylase-like metal-dependent hydrolase (beta-lactamase superfamily II)
MRLPLPMALDHVNVYAFDEDGWTLVDTGLNARRCRAAWEAALAGPLAGAPVRRVIVTHHHPDHVGLAGWFQEQGAELLTTRTAWLFARMLTLDEQETAAGADRVLDAGGHGPGDPRRPAQRKALQLRRCGGADAAGLHADRGGAAPAPRGARLGGALRSWPCARACNAVVEDGDLVIGGDQLLPSISPNLGVYATEPERRPVTEWIEACRRLHPSRRPTALVLPGHKLPFTGLPDRMRQIIDNHHGALERLRAHLAKGPGTAAECFAPLFKRQIDARHLRAGAGRGGGASQPPVPPGRRHPNPARGRGVGLGTCRQSATPLTSRRTPTCREGLTDRAKSANASLVLTGIPEDAPHGR